MKYYFDPEFEKGYKEYRLKKYRDCNHFLVFDQTVCYNGHLDDCYRCIKCNVSELFKYTYYSQHDNTYMTDYLEENNWVMPGFRSKTKLSIYQAFGIYEEVIKNNPCITNEELEKIFLENEKGMQKDSGISRFRNYPCIQL